MPVVALVSLGLGEALVEQSSGRHRAQPAIALDVAAGRPGGWGGALEGAASYGRERSGELDATQIAGHVAALATWTSARGPGRFELGLGPALALTAATWATPDLGTVVVAEPALRLRVGLGYGFGERWLVQARTGAALRPSGLDADVVLAVGFTP